MTAEKDQPAAASCDHQFCIITRPAADGPAAADLQIRLLLSRYRLSMPIAIVVAELAFSNGGAT
jgi:hypothetical protein